MRHCGFLEVRRFVVRQGLGNSYRNKEVEFGAMFLRKSRKRPFGLAEYWALCCLWQFGLLYPYSQQQKCHVAVEQRTLTPYPTKVEKSS